MIKATDNAIAFLIEPTDFDVSAAAEYGEIRTLISRDMSPPSLWASHWQDYVMAKLHDENFDPARDYIVVSGRMLIITMVSCTVAAKYGYVRLLCFDAPRKDYIPITIGEISR